MRVQWLRQSNAKRSSGTKPRYDSYLVDSALGQKGADERIVDVREPGHTFKIGVCSDAYNICRPVVVNVSPNDEQDLGNVCQTKGCWWATRGGRLTHSAGSTALWCNDTRLSVHLSIMRRLGRISAPKRGVISKKSESYTKSR